jgi:hypothetical protein
MPSKKIFVVLIICVAVILSVSIFEWRTNIKILGLNNNPNLTVDSSKGSGDNTNQKNWQDILSNITGTTTIVSQGNSQPLDENNLTAKMAQNYFGQFLILSQNGNQINQNDADQIAQNAISTSDLAIQAKTYTEKDLNIKPTTDNNIGKYFDEIDKSFANNTIIVKSSELDILNQAVLSGKQSDIDKLNPIIAGYNQMISDLIKIPVPSEAVNIHLELLNNTSIVATDIESMKSTLTDPIKGLVGIKQFQINYNNFSLSVQKIEAYFRLKKLMR